MSLGSIDNFPSSRFPPTYVGRVGIALGIPYSWYFDQSKDNVSVKVFIASSFGDKEHVGDERESGCI